MTKKKEDNIIRLAFDADVTEKLEEDYTDSIMEKVEFYGEPPIMIFPESNSLWIPPKLRNKHMTVVGILEKMKHIILHVFQ